jgi:hypothetical protein
MRGYIDSLSYATRPYAGQSRLPLAPIHPFVDGFTPPPPDSHAIREFDRI